MAAAEVAAAGCRIQMEMEGCRTVRDLELTIHPAPMMQEDSKMPEQSLAPLRILGKTMALQNWPNCC